MCRGFLSLCQRGTLSKPVTQDRAKISYSFFIGGFLFTCFGFLADLPQFLNELQAFSNLNPVRQLKLQAKREDYKNGVSNVLPIAYLLQVALAKTSEQLIEQVEYCSGMGAALSTPLWRVSRLEDAVTSILGGVSIISLQQLRCFGKVMVAVCQLSVNPLVANVLGSGHLLILQIGALP